MKKIYSKPVIAFESFSLSNNIAAGCEIIIDNQSRDACAYAYEGGGGQTLFLAAGICDITIPDDTKNGFCYHVPVEGNNLFNS